MNLLPTRFSKVLSLLLLAFLTIATTLPSRAVADDDTIRVGALLSLTGNWSSLGLASQAALEIAVDRMNAQFEQEGSPKHVKLIVEDTKLDPVLAVKKFKDLADRGVTIVVGPQSSSEVSAIRSLADQRHVIVISQGSTAGALAIPGDAVFRFCPTDVHEGEASAALMNADGITAIVPIWRDDAGNNGLYSSTKASFEALQGTVSAGVHYATTETDFTAEIADLASQVHTALAQPNASVAVYLASFDEGISILAAATGNPDLASVRWYGGDGLNLSDALISNTTAATFAAHVSFTTPNLGLDPAARVLQDDLSSAIETRVGFAPDAFALAAYDAAWVGVLARRSIPTNRPFLRLKNAFVNNANRYWGATGATTLDAAGDRNHGNYEFWQVEAGNDFTWERDGSYVNGVIFAQ